MKQIIQWNIEVGGEAEIGDGPIIGIDCRGCPDYVQVWTEQDDQDLDATTRRVRLIAAGVPFPEEDDGEWVGVGTAVTNVGTVHHVIRFMPDIVGYIKPNKKGS